MSTAIEQPLTPTVIDGYDLRREPMLACYTCNRVVVELFNDEYCAECFAFKVNWEDNSL